MIHIRDHPEQHVSQDGQGTCRRPNLFFECPCDDHSETCRFDEQYGPSLVIVPKSLLTTWIKAWKRYYDPRGGLGMQFIVAYSDYSSQHPMTAEAKRQLKCDFYRGLPDLEPNTARPQSHYSSNLRGTDGQERFILLTTKESY